MELVNLNIVQVQQLVRGQRSIKQNECGSQ